VADPDDGAVAVAGAATSSKEEKKTKGGKTHAMQASECAAVLLHRCSPTSLITEFTEKKTSSADAPHLARGTYRIDKKHYFNQDHAKVLSSLLAEISSCSHTSPQPQVMCATLHRSKALDLLVVGFESGTSCLPRCFSSRCSLRPALSGVFALYELPDFNNIHSLSISQKRISTVAVNSTGDWSALFPPRVPRVLTSCLVVGWRSVPPSSDSCSCGNGNPKLVRALHNLAVGLSVGSLNSFCLFQTS
jgi:hypothetical protein